MANTVNSAVPTNLAHGDIQLPPHLAARLEEDHERFGTKQTKEELEASIQAADQRRQDILDGKAAAGHQEVDHAKSVAATHEHKADVQQELLSRVETARADVDQKQAELAELDEMLARASRKEAELKSHLKLE